MAGKEQESKDERTTSLSQSSLDLVNVGQQARFTPRAQSTERGREIMMNFWSKEGGGKGERNNPRGGNSSYLST